MSVCWTTEQQKVIDLRHRNILVSAAAGSGKTAVLVERMVQMILDKEHLMDIDKLLVVTFTKAAASEMKERISSAIEKALENDPENEHLEKQSALLASAQITTIDSFCLYVIRNHFNEINLDPSFRVADETELSLLKSDVLEALLEDKYEEGAQEFLDFVEGYARGKTDKTIEQLILQIYEYSRSYPWPMEWLENCIQLLDVDDVSSLNTHPLIIFLDNYVRSILENLKAQLKYALKICAYPYGPVFYDSALNSDLKMLQSALLADNLHDMQSVIADFKWEPLSRKRMPEVWDEYKNTVKMIRDAVKKQVKHLQENFFYTSATNMVEDIRRTRVPMQVLVQLVKDFSDAFQAVKQEKNIVDFSDLEHFALNILVKKDADGTKHKTAAAVEMSLQFEEVMCDEYQDSNMVQETILKAVSREEDGHPNVFMVGDVKQSIYKFRQARPELFMEKYDTYTMEDSDYQRIDLYKNFRSRACVVDFVNLIFEHIMGCEFGGLEYDERAALYCGASFPEKECMEDEHILGSYTEIIIAETQLDEDVELDEELEEETGRMLEARAVAQKIKDILKSGQLVLDKDSGQYRPATYKDMVILLRSMKGWSNVFAEVLMDEGIPAYSETSGGFFDTIEIRTAVSLLSVIDNPIQDIELAAVMKSCIAQFSDEALAMIRSVQLKGTLYDACQAFLNVDSDLLLSEHYKQETIAEVRAKLATFLKQIEEFRQKATYMSIHQLIRTVFHETGYDDIMSAMPMGQRRRANLELLIEKAVAYEQTSYRGLFNFVRYIERLKTQNTDIGEASVLSEQENVVRLISIHKSKGLEYPIVFVSGMCKCFNKQDIYRSILLHPDDGFGPEAVDIRQRIVSPTILKKAMACKMNMETLSEELRILYVALTRAKEQLYITASVKNYAQVQKKWQQAAQIAGKHLAFIDMAGAASFMDWMMPVLFNTSYREASNAIVQIKVRAAHELMRHRVLEDVSLASAALALEDTLEHMKAAPEYANTYAQMTQWSESHLSWSYPYMANSALPAKMTISEIKRMHEPVDKDAENAPFLRMNKFDEESGAEKNIEKNTEENSEKNIEENVKKDAVQKQAGAFEAAQRGTAVHKILEQLDFTAVHRLQDVSQLIEQCVINHMIDEDIAGKINPWKIFNLVRSPLGKQMAQAQGEGRLHKEYQFIMAVNASEIYKDMSFEEDEVILTQGIIDVWFETPEGIILVDYKTDYVADNDTSVLKKRYQTQLDYYQKAIERLTHQKVVAKLIYSFGVEAMVELEL